MQSRPLQENGNKNMRMEVWKFMTIFYHQRRKEIVLFCTLFFIEFQGIRAQYILFDTDTEDIVTS